MYPREEIPPPAKAVLTGHRIIIRFIFTRHESNNAGRGLRFVRLEMDAVKIVVFVDSSFANNRDFSSQIGFVVVLADGENRAKLIHWPSVKCKRGH